MITDPAALYDTDPWSRKTWVRGCVASGDGPAVCQCAITEYTTRLQPYEYERLPPRSLTAKGRWPSFPNMCVK